jgi:hypothetical protein
MTQKGEFSAQGVGNGLEIPTFSDYYREMRRVIPDVSPVSDFWWNLQHDPHFMFK